MRIHSIAEDNGLLSHFFGLLRMPANKLEMLSLINNEFIKMKKVEGFIEPLHPKVGKA